MFFVFFVPPNAAPTRNFQGGNCVNLDVLGTSCLGQKDSPRGMLQQEHLFLKPHSQEGESEKDKAYVFAESKAEVLSWS